MFYLHVTDKEADSDCFIINIPREDLIGLTLDPETSKQIVGSWRGEEKVSTLLYGLFLLAEVLEKQDLAAGGDEEGEEENHGCEKENSEKESGEEKSSSSEADGHEENS